VACAQPVDRRLAPPPARLCLLGLLDLGDEAALLTGCQAGGQVGGGSTACAAVSSPMSGLDPELLAPLGADWHQMCRPARTPMVV
ncbi:MAG TPA: hypothetical protein VN751_09890, partial [Solirubrobacteraceae bacterium]|nr:hypothetical protein [Solirubrobacteraceae bacterium]